MIFSSRNYAIGMAHYQIAGGTRSLLVLSGVYTAVTSAIIGLVVYNAPAMMLPRIMRPIFTLFLVLEAFILVMFGGMRIAGCIRNDIQSNMIESHRQMPVAAWRAVLGYLFGTTSHVLAIVVLNVITLAILAVVADLQFQEVVMTQIVLGAFAVFIWTFSAMGTLMFRQALPLMILGFVFGTFSTVFLNNFAILPGVSLLAMPFLGETIFSRVGLGSIPGEAYAVALAAQAVFAALFFVGACRRYRGTYLTTFNVPQALGLVIVWGILSAAAIRIWPHLSLPFRRGGGPDVEAQVVAALAVSALMVIAPIYSLAVWESRHEVSAWQRAGALAATLVGAMLILFAGTFTPQEVTVTVLVMMAHILTVYLVLRLLRGSSPMTVLLLTAGLLFAIWLLPMLLEVVRWMMFSTDNGNGVNGDFTMIGALSPLRLLMHVWDRMDIGSTGYFGLAFQWFVPIVLWRWERWRRKSRVMAAVLAAA